MNLKLMTLGSNPGVGNISFLLFYPVRVIQDKKASIYLVAPLQVGCYNKRRT